MVGVCCCLKPRMLQYFNKLLSFTSDGSRSSSFGIREISWSLKSCEIRVKILQAYGILTGNSAAALPRCLLNYKAIWSSSINCRMFFIILLITLRAKLNDQHFVDNTLKLIHKNEKCCTWINISLKFVLKGPINDNPSNDLCTSLVPKTTTH